MNTPDLCLCLRIRKVRIACPMMRTTLPNRIHRVCVTERVKSVGSEDNEYRTQSDSSVRSMYMIGMIGYLSLSIRSTLSNRYLVCISSCDRIGGVIGGVMSVRSITS